MMLMRYVLSVVACAVVVGVLSKSVNAGIWTGIAVLNLLGFLDDLADRIVNDKKESSL